MYSFSDKLIIQSYQRHAAEFFEVIVSESMSVFLKEMVLDIILLWCAYSKGMNLDAISNVVIFLFPLRHYCPR